MSIHDKHKENKMELSIVEHLTNNGWLEGTSHGYDKDLALYSEDLLSFIKTTQPQAYEKMAKREGDKTDEVLLKHVAKELNKNGSLYFLRNEVKYIGSKFKLCQFKPELDNPELQAKYDANILRVVRQVYYSKNNKNSIDLVLFVNGIPITTLELKTDFTQNIQDAIWQYKKNRLPKGEPLLEFKKRCLVHFAVSTQEVYMTTKLAGKNTFFLPFNKGSEDGGAGNPHSTGFATEYLWQEIFSKDMLLNIIARYIHLESKEVENHEGRKSIKETMIFPRYHQLDVVTKLLADTKANGSGKRYLIQHSAGSGKSNSIAWLSHQLSSLHDDNGNAIFNSTIVITDRTVLDNQLQETISSFEHKSGLVVCISRDDANESKSSQLADALERGAKIIITTIQTFPFVLKTIQQRTSLKGNKYAIIADEAHSSQTGAAAKKLKEVLGSSIQIVNGEVSSEDVINAVIDAKSNNNRHLSFYAFTATPKPKTLEMFGILPDPTRPASVDNKPKPFHLYSMKQAIEEGFILDVLRGYTTYKTYYKLEHSDPAKDHEVDSKKAKIKIAKWLNIHPHNISQKVQIIIEHFRNKVAHLLDNQAKAMVVTSSRVSAVRYKQAFDKYIKDNDLDYLSSLVAFSGKVNDEGVEYTEASINTELKGRDMRKAFDTNEYQVMIVANKFQTGFDQPKLCAMYIDKKLGGVNCVQTLSRLNRTYEGKDQTFIIDFANTAEEIQSYFEPYYKDTAIDDVIDPNIVYDTQLKLESNSIFTNTDIENYSYAYFDPKGTQAQMSSALKPAVDRYKVRYKDILTNIKNTQELLKNAKDIGDLRLATNLEQNLSNLGEDKSELDIFKKDMIRFVRQYEFLSQIVDYDDADLEKLCAFLKGLIPNIKTLEISKDEIDLSDVKLTHYKLHKQKEQLIVLSGDKELVNVADGGGKAPKDPKLNFLSEILSILSQLFGDNKNISDEDAINYAKTISDKMSSNQEVIKQIQNNSRSQAMIGGFKTAMDDVVIETLDIHQDMAKKVLSEDTAKDVFANVIYDLILAGIKENHPNI
ncbi:type I restriction endonuclease subunit R [Francisella philomiragia]|uniref:type I restriction endonuclease subunit R n=1 Tax=Francisella philomiragia TaxID=28110 RepID=UPI00190582F4|nr:type I restriction endonuclease [Francisella philomiragia]MBK2297343.1 type I restriction endonuclease subunit R [Francisella philomiragia]